ncbi:MAG: DUF3592 domain-containing protein [Thermoguttaceae bacterium]
MKNSLTGALLAGSVSIAFGGVALAYAIRTGLYAWRSRQWPRVTGTVIKSEAVKVQRRRFSNIFKPVVVYTYEVNGLEYTNDQMGFGYDDFLGDDLFNGPMNAEQVAELYRPGDPVSVAYDPQDNSRSVLKTGINKGHVATTLLGLFFIGFRICCFWSLLSR